MPTPRRRRRKNPRILIVTPEITYLPNGMGNMANRMSAKAGGLADVSSSLVSALFDLGADVHVALPHYRRMFHIDAGKLINEELRVYMNKLPRARIHLAEDRCFYYRDAVYADDVSTNKKVALAFQREVINNIIPSVDPDLIHCNDWMTGLVPAAARRLGIPSLFTVHNIHSYDLTLSQIEDAGIDAAEFWKYLFYGMPPWNYEESRNHNPVDLLASGVFASHFINTVSPTFLNEVCRGEHDFVPANIRYEMLQKSKNDCASGILNAPDPANDPETDEFLPLNYTAETHVEGKRANKAAFQERVGLKVDPNAPIFFWPSRLDPVQKGCQLLSDILYDMVSSYWGDNLQVAIVANGSYQPVFHDIVRQHDFGDHVAVCDFGEPLSRHGYAASDFMIIPSLFEPCGLPQMVSSIYGSLPIARNTGGLHDTVTHLDVSNDTGNGFLFDTYDAGGLRWAVDEAMEFFRQPDSVKADQIERIMRESKNRFNHQVTAQSYFDIYETMLNRPIVKDF
ncbi:MAG: glycosyltransferase [Verrucomicrobia bacterium]|nr:glycosyltransferase [Verrucomicrobiota bacterium]